MAATRLLMRRLRELLRLKYDVGLTHRAIAQACTVGLGTVTAYLQRATAAGLTWPLPDDLGDAALEARVFARPAVSAADREQIAATLAPTGKIVWLDDEAALDAVTALSGSGPAYVFHLIEAMLAAGREMGLGDDEARRLAVQTVAGAAALAAASSDSPETLRRNVTSPGGTTHAAMTLIEARGVKAAWVEAILAARDRARELGDEFGRPAS